MNRDWKRRVSRWLASAGLGVMLAAGCSAEQISSVLTGLGEVAENFGDGQAERDLGFGEWLAMGVEDF